METGAKFLTCKGDFEERFITGEEFHSKSSAAEQLSGIVDLELMNQEFTETEVFTINYNDVKFSALSIDEAVTNILYAQMKAKFCGRVLFTANDLRYKSLNQRLEYAWCSLEGHWVIRMMRVNSITADTKEVTFEFKKIICPF